MKKFLGYSWLGWLNQLIIQWFFIRLQATLDDSRTNIEGLQIIGFILPLTGWWSDYIWLGEEFEVPLWGKSD
jgi:hypothetical protein